VMELLWASGMRELRKRQGLECVVCGIPLGVYEEIANAEGRTLTCCPNENCNAPFVESAVPPPSPGPAVTVTTYECPSCRSQIAAGQTRCTCGAVVDYSMAPGTESDVTTPTTTTELVPTWGRSSTYSAYVVPPPVPVWGYGGYDYGYVAYRPYDMWDFAVDVAAFSCLCAFCF